jgi:hypothetical protein
MAESNKEENVASHPLVIADNGSICFPMNKETG